MLTLEKVWYLANVYNTTKTCPLLEWPHNPNFICPTKMKLIIEYNTTFNSMVQFTTSHYSNDMSPNFATLLQFSKFFAKGHFPLVGSNEKQFHCKHDNDLLSKNTNNPSLNPNNTQQKKNDDNISWC